MLLQIARILVFVLIALPFAYMAFDVAREISKELNRVAAKKLIPIKVKHSINRKQ